jgi:aminopeptidase N
MILLTIYFLQIQNILLTMNQIFIPVGSGLHTQEQIIEPGFLRYDVIRYNLNIAIDVQNTHVVAHNTIVYETVESLADIQFHLAGMNVDSVKEAGSVLSFVRTNDMIDIELPLVKNQGISDSITIFYSGTPARGLYFRTNDYGDTIVYTHNEPYDARFWFPCKDYPSDKALLNLKVKYRQNFTSVSNGILLISQPDESGWKYDFWQESNPIATYLIAISVGRFHKIENYDIQDKFAIPVLYYVYPEEEERGNLALAATIPMLDFYSSFIGLYPFFNEKYAMIEVPLREASAMENQTCTMMRDLVMDDPEIIAHELAHQWWGNAVTPVGFNDIWLNEGFASYFDALYTEFTEGNERFLERMSQYRSGIFQDGSVVYPVGSPPPDHLFSAAVYLKGAWILHMLRFEVGENNFREIIRTYYDRFKYSNAASLDFQLVCEEITGSDLDLFFSQWLYRGGIPNLQLTWNQSANNVTFTIEQVQEGPVYDLTLDMKITGINSDTLIVVRNNSRSKSYQLNFSEPVISMELDPSCKILNANNTPVYVVPQKPQLGLIYPNPFNEQVTITYDLEQIQEIEISIWNVLGQKVESLFKGHGGIGRHKLNWLAKNRPSGIYFCRLESESGTDIKKLMLLK